MTLLPLATSDVKCHATYSVTLLLFKTESLEAMESDVKFRFQDIKLTSANDDNYFVFEDLLCQVCTCD